MPGQGGQVVAWNGPEWRSFDNNPRLWSYVFAVWNNLTNGEWYVRLHGTNDV